MPRQWALWFAWQDALINVNDWSSNLQFQITKQTNIFMVSVYIEEKLKLKYKLRKMRM